MPVVPEMGVWLAGREDSGEVVYVATEWILVNDSVSWPDSPRQMGDWFERAADTLFSTHEAAQASQTKEPTT